MTKINEEEKIPDTIKALQPKPLNQSPIEMIKAAKEAGVEAKDLKEFLDLQLQYEKQQRELARQDRQEQAEIEFNSAMSRAHAAITTVVKTKDNKQTHSKYADLDNIITSAKPAYTAEGFSVSFYEGEGAPENHIRIFADIAHALGHKITRHYDVPMDGEGFKGNANMTKIHGKASSVSYGRRYLLCMIWNIPTGDDNDGNGAEKTVTPISEEKMASLQDWMTSKNVSEKGLLKWLQLERMDQIDNKICDKAIQGLKNMKKKT